MPNSALSKKTKRTLYAMFALFLLPFIAATSAYYYRDSFTLSTKNYGSLVTPPQAIQAFSLSGLTGDPIAKESLNGKWWLVLVAPKNCSDCMLQMKKLESVFFALNRDSPRVRLLVLNTQLDDIVVPPQSENDILDYVIDGEHSSPFARELMQSTTSQLLIIDPLGNIVMRYPANAQGNGILRDMLQLLKVSRIG